MKNKILAVCSERGDSWASAVKARILQVHDIHAADAVYHRTVVHQSKDIYPKS